MKTPQEAMAVLVDCMLNKSGQSYKIRNLLYSLWNGAPIAELIEVRGLDHKLRFALCLIIMSFGNSFEYDDIKAPLVKAGLFEWFILEGEKVEAKS